MGMGWVGSVIWWVGLGWVDENRPMDNSDVCRFAAGNLLKYLLWLYAAQLLRVQPANKPSRDRTAEIKSLTS